MAKSSAVGPQPAVRRADPGPLIIVGCLTLFAFVLRVHHLGAHSLWYDELLELDIAQGPFFEIGQKLIRHAAMPLDYILLHGWISLGRQDGWVRFPALVFGVLAVPLIYALASRIINRRVGYLAAFLLAVSAFAVRYSQEARPYALLLSLVMVAFLGLWQVYRTGRSRYWVMVILGTVGAGLTHYFTIFLLLPMGLFVLVQQIYHFRVGRYWLHTVYFALLVLLLLIVYTTNGRLGHLYSVGDRYVREVGQVETYSIPAPDKPNRGNGPPLGEEFFRDKVLIPLTSTDPEALLFYGAFFLLGTLPLMRPGQPHRAALLLLLGWLLLPILLICTFLLHRGTFYAVRYILYTLPACLILVATGMDTFARSLGHLVAGARTIGSPLHSVASLTRTCLQSGLLLVLLLPLLLAQVEQRRVGYAAGPYEDWRAVAQMLGENAEPGDAVVAVRAEPTMNWYYPAARAPFGTYNRSESIWQSIGEHKRRWFVLSSYSFRHDKSLRDWLSRQEAVKIIIDRRIVVYFHHEGRSRAEMLRQVKEFSLPQRYRTYRSLAVQLEESGDIQTSQSFYRIAEELENVPGRSAAYLAHLSDPIVLD